MKQEPLIDLWNNCNDEELAAFIRLLRVTDAIAHLFPEGTDEDEGIDYALAEVAYNKKLETIKKHKLFKLLMKNEAFFIAYRWTDNSQAPKQYKTSENKIRLLESVVIAFTLYARRSAGKRLEPASSRREDAVKTINKKARNLIAAIEEAGSILESPLKECCDDTIRRLQFMSEYKRIKSPKMGAARNKQVFMSDLVGWLKRHDLVRSPTFIGCILPMIGDSVSSLDKSNLIKNINAHEKKFDLRQKQLHASWKN